MMLPLLLFAVLSCSTPGPNTLMLAACGANFGFRLSLPYSAGIVVGRACLQTAVILFLGALFTAFPPLHAVLRVLGSLYLAYLSYTIATARPLERLDPGDRQLTFGQAALYQFVNPKVWANTTTAVSVFVRGTEDFYLHAALVVVTFALVSAVANSLWTLFGVQIGKLLRSPGSLRLFNYSMGALNAACIVLIWA